MQTEPQGSGKKRSGVKSSLALITTAVIWGVAFVAQRAGMDFVGPFMFISVRMLLGALTLVIIFLLMGHFAKRRSSIRAAATSSVDKNQDGEGVRGTAVLSEGSNDDQLTVELHANTATATNTATLAATNTATLAAAARTAATTTVNDDHGAPKKASNMKALMIAGIICGTVLFLGGSLQQVGLVFTTASKAGFLTTLYIILVPILGLFVRQKTHWNTWVSVAIAAVGLYFLSITEGFGIEIGDTVILIGALFWALHILVIDHFVSGITRRDVLKVCAWQFATAGVLAALASPFLDGYFAHGNFELQAFANALPAILFAGVLSTGVAFTLQAIGQQGLNPTAASIIMSTEAVFALIFGIILLGEVLTLREIIGCILMFGAVVLSQIPVKQKTLRT